MSSHHGEEHAIHVPQPSFSPPILGLGVMLIALDRKSTRLNSSHSQISYAVFCLKKKNNSHFSEHVSFSPPGCVNKDNPWFIPVCRSLGSTVFVPRRYAEDRLLGTSTASSCISDS